MSKKGGSAPAPPDYSGVQSDISAWIGSLTNRADELENWWMDEYQDLKSQADSIYAFQWDTAEDLRAYADEDRQRYENVFVPLQDELIDKARNWASDDEISRVRGEAIADVGTAFEAARENALRDLESYGVDPSSTRRQALDVGVRTDEATAKAFGANTAARNRELEAQALQQGAVNMGAGLPEGAYRGQVAGSNVTNQALSGAGITASTGAQGATMTTPYYGMQGSGYGMQADILSSDYQNRIAAYAAEQAAGNDLGGIGAVAGGAIGSFWGPVGAMAGSTIGGAAGSMIQYADGGPVERYAGGGAIPDGSRVEGSEYGVFTGDRDGDETADKIPAYLSENEFVIPADVVKRKGTEFFDGLIEKTRGGGKSSKPKDNKLAGGGQAQGIPALPGPVAPLPPRVATGQRQVPSAGGRPTTMPTARYKFDAALDALALKYGTGAGVAA